GIPAPEVRDRPLPRPVRNTLERVRPKRWIPLACGESDITGRALDLAAPLGMGCAGIIYGPHGAGLTTTLRSVVQGVVTQPDVLTVVLLIGARGEEITDWRRRFLAA